MKCNQRRSRDCKQRCTSCRWARLHALISSHTWSNKSIRWAGEWANEWYKKCIMHICTPFACCYKMEWHRNTWNEWIFVECNVLDASAQFIVWYILHSSSPNRRHNACAPETDNGLHRKEFSTCSQCHRSLHHLNSSHTRWMLASSHGNGGFDIVSDHMDACRRACIELLYAKCKWGAKCVDDTKSIRMYFSVVSPFRIDATQFHIFPSKFNSIIAILLRPSSGARETTRVRQGSRYLPAISP